MTETGKARPPRERQTDPEPRRCNSDRTRATTGHGNRSGRPAGHVPPATGEYFPPAGRRRLGIILVRSCPRCGGAHLHRAVAAGAADGAVRAGSCGKLYCLHVSVTDRRRGAA